MNSGQAQASHAGHSMISIVKGKHKSKSALASSLVGSLFSLIPGAVSAKPGFKVTMKQIMDGKSMPGTRLTRMPWDSGKGPPKGFNLLEAGPAITVSRLSGLTDPHVLEFSEVTRGSPVRQNKEVNGKQVPNLTPQGVQPGTGVENTGAHSGAASKTANQPNGSVTGSPKPGGSSEGLLASNISRPQVGQDQSRSPNGIPSPKEGVTGVQDLGEAQVAGASSNRSLTKIADLANTSSGDVKSSPENGVRSTQLDGISRRVQISLPGDLPGNKNPDSIPDVGKTARQVQSSQIGMKSVQANSRSIPLFEGEQSQLDGSLKLVSSENQISGQGYRQKPTAPGFIFGELRNGVIRSDSARKVGKSRIVNQPGLEINHASPNVEDKPSKIRSVPDYPGSASSHGKQAATPKVVPAGSAGSNDISSLTDQNVSRDMMMGNEAPHRGFVKPVMVGIPEMTRNRKPVGKEINSLMGQSLLSPTQSTNGMSAALGSLARLTVSQYFRFISSEQPNSTFTFNGGTLGNVQLSFRETDSGTVLHIVVESSEIRHLIQRTLPSLERDWIQEGLEFSDVNVEVGDAGYQWTSPGTEDQTRIPTQQESAGTLQVTAENIEQAIKDYGYNTLEFVA